MPYNSNEKHHAWCVRNIQKKRISAKKWYDLHGKEYYLNIKIKVLARRLVTKAILNSDLIKKPCEICGEIKVHAHHEDYSKPLEVRWLCDYHHRQRHTELGDNKHFKNHEQKYSMSDYQKRLRLINKIKK